MSTKKKEGKRQAHRHSRHRLSFDDVVEFAATGVPNRRTEEQALTCLPMSAAVCQVLLQHFLALEVGIWTAEVHKHCFRCVLVKLCGYMNSWTFVSLFARVTTRPWTCST